MTADVSTVPHLETALKGPLLALEKQILANQFSIETWFREQWQLTPPAFYGSVDLRNAGFKLAPVDTNLFPAGFNNLNPDVTPLVIQAIQATVAEICPNIKRILIVPENHTRNQFYFKSLYTLYEFLLKAGFAVEIGSVNPELTAPQHVQVDASRSLTIKPIKRVGDQIGIDDFYPCFVLLNNDLSDGVPAILKGLKQIITPPTLLGWSNRLKSGHFECYQVVCENFAKVINIDPWLVHPYFDNCIGLDFMQKEGNDELIGRADQLIQKIQLKYKEYNINKPPFLFVKADAGTYGMAVMMIKNPKELAALNRKQRTNMSASKGGSSVSKVIIQEGVYSFETVGAEKVVAEPVVYGVGRHVVGGFYRIHEKRGPNENLNAPGMDFVPLAFSKPCHIPDMNAAENVNRFYAYSVVARLALLAAASELKQVLPNGFEPCDDNE
ncbi:MAG: glutamate--cysteine ligase [Gammaproteobacteria bacterium RIFCSPHIGHO2_12_FULL_41_15]|nr:MAG: glutamate--cysteine ligase [Gammaproteobacteria bacterium RIFCSPHIGHO2_12_FULL_41_15]